MIGYELEELIGHGGMGVVYRATDVKLQRPVALKLIVPELAEDARFRKRFLDESRLAASLDHASVVPIYEAGEQDGQLFLAMRYVEGSDLRTLLRRDGPLALERTLALLGQIASALDAAHRSGLVHRDVKPANILVDDDDHAYLTDFGVSKQLGGVTTDTGRLVGSLDYLAPEQIAGGPRRCRSTRSSPAASSVAPGSSPTSELPSSSEGASSSAQEPSAQGSLMQAGHGESVDLGDTRYRAIESESMRSPPGTRILVLAPQSAIDRASASIGKRLILTMLITLVLLILIALLRGTVDRAQARRLRRRCERHRARPVRQPSEGQGPGRVRPARPGVQRDGRRARRAEARARRGAPTPA